MTKVIAGTTKDGQAELAEAINSIRRGEASEVQIILNNTDTDVASNLNALAKKLSKLGECFSVTETAWVGGHCGQLILSVNSSSF